MLAPTFSDLKPLLGNHANLTLQISALRKLLGAPARLVLTQCLAGLEQVEQARHEFRRWSTLAPEPVAPLLSSAANGCRRIRHTARTTGLLRLAAALDEPDAAHGSEGRPAAPQPLTLLETALRG